MKLSNKLSALLALIIALVAFSSVSAQDVVELRVLLYNDGNEGEVLPRVIIACGGGAHLEVDFAISKRVIEHLFSPFWR